MNTKVATDGLENPRGIQTARILRKNVESGFVAEDEITHVFNVGHCWCRRSYGRQ